MPARRKKTHLGKWEFSSHEAVAGTPKSINNAFLMRQNTPLAKFRQWRPDWQAPSCFERGLKVGLCRKMAMPRSNGIATACTLGTWRIFEPVDKADGHRVLVDRFWPRGVSKKPAAASLSRRGLSIQISASYLLLSAATTAFPEMMPDAAFGERSLPLSGVVDPQQYTFAIGVPSFVTSWLSVAIFMPPYVL